MCWLPFIFILQQCSSFTQVFLSACFEDFIKKLALVQCALGSDTIQRSLITMTSLLFPFPFLFSFPSLPLLCVGEEKKSTILPQTGVILPCLGPLIFNSTVLQVCLCHYFSDLFVLHPASACLLLSGFKQNFSLLTRIIFGTCKIFLLYCSLPVQLQWAAWFRRITCRGKERLQHPQQSWYNALFVSGLYSCMVAA